MSRKPLGQRTLHRTGLALLRERIRHIKRVLDQTSVKILNLSLEISQILSKDIWETIDRISFVQAEHTYLLRTQKQTEKFLKLTRQDKPNPPLTHSVTNLTEIPLSQPALSVLAKGHNFAIAPKRISREEIISQIESALSKRPSEKANKIRIKSTNILKQAAPPKPNLTKDEASALLELRKNKDIIILPADKGNSTVVMSRHHYHDKVIHLLEDNTYGKLRKDPTNCKSIERKNSQLIQRAKLPPTITKSILPKESRSPRFYGLPKIHKADTPLRPIVSAVDSPAHPLPKFLNTILTPLTGKTKSHIQNSVDFVNKIQQIKTNPDDILINFDVKSLLTNVRFPKLCNS